jgi:hypothetical protein
VAPLRTAQDGGRGLGKEPCTLLHTFICELKPRGEAAATAQLNASAISVWGGGPVGNYSGGLAGSFSVLALLLGYCFRGVEILSHLKNLSETLGIICRVAERCCCCCRRGSCGRRQQPECQWVRLLDRESLWELEERERHNRALKLGWNRWNKIGREIRNSHLSPTHVHWTWQLWNQYQGRLRTHAWHRVKKARELLRK